MEDDKVTEVELGYNETLVITLPDGQKVSILLSYLEPGEQLPELDVMFERPLTVNCFVENLVLSTPSPVTAKQLIVPMG